MPKDSRQLQRRRPDLRCWSHAAWRGRSPHWPDRRLDRMDSRSPRAPPHTHLTPSTSRPPRGGRGPSAPSRPHTTQAPSVRPNSAAGGRNPSLRAISGLGDQPPLTRWVPSDRPRPQHLPDVAYPVGAILRKVSTAGDIRYHGYRILCGRAITGQPVRVDEREHELAVFYCHKQIGSLSLISRGQRQPDIMR